MWIHNSRPVSRYLGIQISFSISNPLWKILVLSHLDALAVWAALVALSEVVADVDVAEVVDAADVAVVDIFREEPSLQVSCRGFSLWN